MIKRELNNINTPYFVKTTPNDLSVVSEPVEYYGLKEENLALKNELIEKKAIITYL